MSNEINQDSGNFSAVPNEILEYLMQSDLTARELRLVLFVIREVQGYGLNRKIIKTDRICAYSRIARQHINTTMRSLIKKGIIQRTEINSHKGEFEYTFRKELFGRINATKKVSDHYCYEGRVISNSKSSSPSQLRARHQVSDANVTKSVTPTQTEKASKTAAVAAFERSEKSSKDILKKGKDILRGGLVDTFSNFGREKTQEQIQKRKAFLEAQAVQLQSEGDACTTYSDSSHYCSSSERGCTS